MKSYILVLVAFLISISGVMGCKKDKAPEDPFANLNNSATCKINGQTWISNDKFGGFFHISGIGKRYVYLRFKNGMQEIDFYLNSPYNRTYYIFNRTTIDFPTNSDPEDYASFIKSYPNLTPEEVYITSSIDNGRIDFVTFDTTAKVIKAKFSFVGKNNQTGQKINITDGYFEYHR